MIAAGSLVVFPELSLAHGGGGGGHGFGGGGFSGHGFGSSTARFSGRRFGPGFSGTYGFSDRNFFGRADHQFESIRPPRLR